MNTKLDRVVAKIISIFHIYNDSIFGIILTLGSIYLFSMSFSIKIMKTPVSGVDTARFFPQLVFGALIPIGIVMIIRGLFKAKQLRETVPSGEQMSDQVLAFKRSVVALAAIAVFIAGMQTIGFIPMAVIYMVFNMMFMSEKSARKIGLFIIISVIVAILLYFVFRQFIYVRLPEGILKGVLS